MRQCVCGEQIEPCLNLCDKCKHKYGSKQATWPEWLSNWMKNYQKELNYERNNFHLKYIDEINYGARVI
jgi:hypothetical protein